MKWVPLQGGGDVPEARSSHSITAVGDALYLFGGEHAPRVPVGSDIHAYRLADRAWRKLEVCGTPPSVRNACAAAAIGPDIYFFGGRCGIDMGEGSLNDLHRFNTATATWAAAELAPGSPLPPKRSYHALAATGGCLYLFGGCGEACVGRLNDLWRYDPAKATWRQLPTSDAIKGRGGAGLAATQDALFVVAGFAGQEMNDVHRFDLATETWDCPRCCAPATTALPAGTAAAAASPGSSCSHAEPAVVLPARSVSAVVAHSACDSCPHGGHIVVFGGEVDPSTLGHAGAGSYSNEAFCLDPSCQHWHVMQPSGLPPAPRGWMAATACAQGVVVHGGNGVNNERLADMFLLQMH